MKTLFRIIFFFAGLLPLASVAQVLPSTNTGTAQNLPSADAVIARYVELIGGRQRWGAIKTSEFHFKATVGSRALKGLIVKTGPGR